MAPLAQQKTQRGGHGDGAIGVRVASGAFGMRPLGERSVRARNDFVAVGESDLRLVLARMTVGAFATPSGRRFGSNTA